MAQRVADIIRATDARLGHPAELTIVDIGCGDGFLLNSLERKFDVAHGIDLSERPIAFANAFSQRAKFEVKDVATVDRKYDIATLIEVLEHVPDDMVPSFVDSAKRVIAPGGHFVVCVPTTVYPLNEKHYRHYDEALLRRDLGPLEGWEIEREVRVHRVSKSLTRALRAMNNRLFSVRSARAWKALWNWHKAKGFEANKNDGAHLVMVLRRSS